MKGRRMAAGAAILMLGLGAGCGREADEPSGTASAAGGANEGKRAALVIAQGGLGDRSYNDLANAGFESGLRSARIQGRAIESNDVVAQAQPILERATSGGFGLVVDLEFSHAEALERIAAANPKTQYGFLNAPVKGRNVTSVLFAEHEGSYLAGVLAARMTTQEGEKLNPEREVGVIGGTKSTGIDKFIVGFIQGVRDTDPQVRVRTAYANDFADPSRGRQIANSMYARGADIVYHVAGGTGAGVFEAARERNRYAIGVDTDQDSAAPGFVLTSMIKRADLGVKRLVEDFAAGRLKGGSTVNLGLRENGVGLSPMRHTRDAVPAEVMADVEEARKGIVDGSIEVWNVIEQGYPSFYEG